MSIEKNPLHRFIVAKKKNVLSQQNPKFKIMPIYATKKILLVLAKCDRYKILLNN